MPDRSLARDLADKHLAANDPTGWFEALYTAAAGDTAAIPWADQRPNPNVTAWLDAHGRFPPGARGLVVGCGLGDDAEHLARRGLTVTAFDIAPTAIAWCRKRFPDSPVTYAVADLLDPPADWPGRFDFVWESYTLQALPPDLRSRAFASLARLLAPAGRLLIVCRARDDHDPPGGAPWPFSRPELDRLSTAAGLVAETFEDYADTHEAPPVRRFRALYRLTTAR